MRYCKYEETHVQRGYGTQQVESLLRQAGLEVLAVYDAYTKDPVREDSGRVCFVAREQGKGYNKA